MRFKDPPEKLLKKSSTPPVVLSPNRPSAVGSTPGSGTKLSKRNTISAAMVNHSRFLRSVACANFDRLSPEASCRLRMPLCVYVLKTETAASA